MSGARRFLERHHSESVRLGDVATAVGVSPTYLCDVFHRHVGVPLHRYLTHVRLTRALERLDDYRGRIGELGLEVGFSSASHFSTAFKAFFGRTPSQSLDGPDGPRA